MINVLVTGAKGQLGSELAAAAPHKKEYRFVWTDVDRLDIADRSAVEALVKAEKINLIVNCAAYTNVDRAESDPDTARRINVEGCESLAAAALHHGACLIHISTDYVFDGTGHRPYTEEDPSSPLGVYGKTKREGEKRIVESGCLSAILRTSWLYSPFGNNFVKTMLRLGGEKPSLGVVFDQVGTPTYAADLARTILAIAPSVIEKGLRGETYHFSNEGVTSWYDFADQIFEIAALQCRALPILSRDFPSAAPRPAYSVLDKSKIKRDFSLEIPHWRDSLKECIAHLSR